jgi:hypothetical protein
MQWTKQLHISNKNIGGTKMKFNKWTLGLAAVGAVSLTSVAQAEEKMNAVQSALSSTTISGYVDTSMQWNIGTQGGNGGGNYPPYAFGGASKADGFNLNVVQLTIAKALDESEWASGYRADIWFGPDAVTLASQFSGGGDVAIRQAYVALRTPIGNGIDWKIGVFDSIIGYETLESGSNPNMTRSYGFTIEPTTLTGLLATYRINDSFSVSGGIANTFGPTINGRANPPQAESFKTYTGAIAFTAPSSWGWAAGSSMYAGFITGYNPNITAPFNALAGGTGTGQNATHYYVGATIATPVAGLKCGAAFDYLYVHNQAATGPAPNGNFITVPGLYISYQATEKLSFHGRGEYVVVDGGPTTSDLKGYELTGTIQYDLWQNVISRLEIRWDNSQNVNWPGPAQNTTGFVNSAGVNNQHNAVMVAANFIYKF